MIIFLLILFELYKNEGNVVKMLYFCEFMHGVYFFNQGRISIIKLKIINYRFTTIIMALNYKAYLKPQ